MLAHDKSRLKGVRGHRVSGESDDESGHFHICGECGQAFDLSSLPQVIHHDKIGHEPLSEAQLAKLLR